MIQTSMFTEAEARDAGTSAVLEHAGDDWRADARNVFLRMEQEELTGEDIRLECEAAGIRPHHNNAWGAFVLTLVRERLLEPTGRYEPMRAKGSHARKTQVYRRSSEWRLAERNQ